MRLRTLLAPAALAALVACGGAGDPKDDNGPLYAAIERGDAAAVRALLDRGADPNSTVIKGRFGERAPRPSSSTVPVPLVAAIEADHSEIVEALLAKGAQPNVADAKGRTPLEHALSKGNPATVRALVARRADVNAPTMAGVPMLFLGACTGKPEIVGALLAAGAPVDARDAKDVAVRYCVTDTESAFDALRARLHRNRVRPNATPLHVAAFRGDAAVADTLLAHGAAVDAVDAAGRTALMVAADASPAASVETNRLDVVRVLLRRGASPRLRDAEGFTALDRARTLAGLSALHAAMVPLLGG